MLSAAAGAGVINGTIYNLDVDGDGFAHDVKVARVAFNVTAGTRVFFDSLVLESDGTDLNGDGYITGFDNYMMLFGPNLQVLASNDDSDDTFNDGSVDSYDSALDHVFDTAGTYTITVGKIGYGLSDAQLGYHAYNGYLADVGAEDFGAWRLTMTATDGTLSDVRELSVALPQSSPDGGGKVPEPASLVLLGAGLFGCAVARRKHKGSARA